MKYCVDCKHAVNELITRCKHPSLGIDPVTGLNKTTWCLSYRSDDKLLYDNACGPEAIYFEEIPKEEPKTKGLIAWLTNVFS